MRILLSFLILIAGFNQILACYARRDNDGTSKTIDSEEIAPEVSIQGVEFANKKENDDEAEITKLFNLLKSRFRSIFKKSDETDFIKRILNKYEHDTEFASKFDKQLANNYERIDMFTIKHALLVTKNEMQRPYVKPVNDRDEDFVKGNDQQSDDVDDEKASKKDSDKGVGNDKVNKFTPAIKHSDEEVDDNKQTTAPKIESLKDDGYQPTNRHDHKYEIEAAKPPKFRRTSTTLIPSDFSLPLTATEYNLFREYAGIREGLNTQQESLQTNKQQLEKDFYSLIESNYDEGSLNKFEADIRVLYENNDKIKKKINALQNLHSKLYVRKLVADAINDVENDSKKERFEFMPPAIN